MEEIVLTYNLLESLKEHLSGDVISNLATLIGESPKNTESALHTALPLLLAELVDQNLDAKSVGNLINLLVEGKHDGGVLSNLGALSRGGEDTTKLIAEGGKLLSSFFGDKLGGIADLVVSTSGISKDSSSSLLGFVMPLILGLVGRDLKIENSENTAGLLGLLSDQSAYLKNFIPAAVTKLSAGEALEAAISKTGGNVAETAVTVSNVADDSDEDDHIISVTAVEDMVEKTVSSAKNMAEEVGESASQFGSHIVEESKEFVHSAADAFEESAGGGRNILPWILLVAALALAWGLLKSCSVPPTTPDATAPTIPPAAVVVPASPVPVVPATEVTVTPEPTKVEAPTVEKADDKASFEKSLSTGFVIKSGKDGFESKLVAFIEGNEAISKDLWFTMDGITFDTNKATIKAESNAQINDIAEILKAYPKVKIKIGGYTDSDGEASANQKLSNSRANAVKEVLVSKGTSVDRIAAEGYGSEHPVASNDTEEGRQKNRRIDVLVTEK
jgi:OmpA-OmpF porin, OOP family